MQSWLRDVFQGRPGWMNLLMVFSAYMAFVYMPWDIFIKPAAEDVEVWFGIKFHGTAAKIMALPHWAIYAAGAYGFRNMKSWMWPWAAVYVAQIAIGMLVWNLVYGASGFFGLLIALIAFAVFVALARELWRAQESFDAGERNLAEHYGGWALVTGASAGLGAEFARHLARDGVNCALTARRADRLAELAAELEANYGIETRVIAADLEDTVEVERVADAVADLDVAILVNNAGLGGAGRFHKVELDRLKSMVAVNCMAPTILTHRLLPKLRERGRGAIVFTGSVAGRVALPLHGVYSATKAFDLFLGESLAVELADDRIDVLVLEPGSTETEFQSVAGEIAHGGESPVEVVAVAFEALGRKPSVISGWKNWMRGALLPRLLPRALIAHVARDVIRDQTPDEMR